MRPMRYDSASYRTRRGGAAAVARSPGRTVPKKMQTNTPRIHKEMIGEDPIEGLVKGWHVRRREVSNG